LIAAFRGQHDRYARCLSLSREVAQRLAEPESRALNDAWTISNEMQQYMLKFGQKWPTRFDLTE